jgi:hypothetical protein
LRPGGLALRGQQDITLIKALAGAFRSRRMLETGRYGTIDEIAAAAKFRNADQVCVSPTRFLGQETSYEPTIIIGMGKDARMINEEPSGPDGNARAVSATAAARPSRAGPGRRCGAPRPPWPKARARS